VPYLLPFAVSTTTTNQAVRRQVEEDLFPLVVEDGPGLATSLIGQTLNTAPSLIGSAVETLQGMQASSSGGNKNGRQLSTDYLPKLISGPSVHLCLSFVSSFVSLVGSHFLLLFSKCLQFFVSIQREAMFAIESPHALLFLNQLTKPTRGASERCVVNSGRPRNPRLHSSAQGRRVRG
jgi:hypothetical protein